MYWPLNIFIYVSLYILTIFSLSTFFAFSFSSIYLKLFSKLPTLFAIWSYFYVNLSSVSSDCPSIRSCLILMSLMSSFIDIMWFWTYPKLLPCLLFSLCLPPLSPSLSSSVFQPIPGYASLVHPIPAYFSLFLAFSSLFQTIPDYLSLF